MSFDYFHIGLHKTASTWLQKQIFSQLEDVNYFDHSSVYEHIILPKDGEFDRKRCNKSLIREKRINIFSSERLSGNPHSGYYDNYLLAQRIKEISKDAKIILILREQKSMVVSCYKQYIKSGGTCSFEEYVFPPSEGRIPLFSIKSLEYDVMVRCYFDLFGKDNVLVLPFELLKKDRAGFIKRIGKFIGLDFSEIPDIDIKRNIALNDFQVGFIRTLNVLGGDTSINPHKTRLYNISNKLSAAVKKIGNGPLFNKYHANYPERAEKLIKDRFAASNQRLCKLVPESLINNY